MRERARECERESKQEIERLREPQSHRARRATKS